MCCIEDGSSQEHPEYYCSPAIPPLPEHDGRIPQRNVKDTKVSQPTSCVDDDFYNRLIGGLQDWRQEGLLVDVSTRSDCESFLFKEARLLDNG